MILGDLPAHYNNRSTTISVSRGHVGQRQATPLAPEVRVRCSTEYSTQWATAITVHIGPCAMHFDLNYMIRALFSARHSQTQPCCFGRR